MKLTLFQEEKWSNFKYGFLINVHFSIATVYDSFLVPLWFRKLSNFGVGTWEKNNQLFLTLQTDQQLDCALDLMRRLPPQQIEKNLSDLIDLVPDLCEDLLSSIDQPLKVASDKKVGKDYLLCDYNRDGDSYR